MTAAQAGSGARRRRATSADPLHGGAFEAEVAGVSADGRAQVRRPGGPSSLLPCDVAVPGYQARPGDRVVVTAAAGGRAAWIIGVLAAPTAGGIPEASAAGIAAPSTAPAPPRIAASSSIPPGIAAPSGATAALEDGTLVLRDPQGALVAAYDAGRSTLRIGEGLARVEIGAADGTVAIAAREVQICAGARASVAAPDLSLTADRATLKAEQATLTAAIVHTMAEELAHTAARWDINVGRLIERASEAYREAELAETRADRARVLARAAFDVIAGRTTLLSDDDTIIDGKRVLLG